MKKKALLTILLLSVCAATVNAQDIIFARSADTTAEDINLTFTPEKTTWTRGKLYVWGKVRNTSDKTLDYVKIFFTAKSANGNFISRVSLFTDPRTIGPRQVGYIEEKPVDCEGEMPAKIEYNILGDTK